MTTIAIIPARGGSKGIVGKNLVDLNGKPLIDYTLAAAKEANVIDQIFVSTDDENIADYCISRNVKVPYRRPPNIALDNSSMIEVVLDALEWLEKNERQIPDKVIVLQPTSPLRNSQDIDQALKLMLKLNYESMTSVHKMTEHPYECVQEDGQGWKNLVEFEGQLIRRQDYQGHFYFINGAIYAMTPGFIERHKALFCPGNQTMLFPMPPHRGIDIDTYDDLYRAEAYLSHPRLSQNN